MDSEKRIIPVVEDDQGEGFMDPLEEMPSDLERLLKEKEKILQRNQRKNYRGKVGPKNGHGR